MDKCNCEFYWKEVSKFSSVCSKHNSTFDNGSKCPYWDISIPASKPLISLGNVNSKKDTSNQLHGKVTVNHGKSRLVNREKRIYERFHSFRKSFKAEIDFEGINGNFKRLNNNVFYKQLEFPTALVQVFKKSVLIILRNTQEIKNLKVKEANILSNKLINDIVVQLPKEIKVLDSKIVEVHNAFVNHPIAKRNVTVKINNEVRFISDNSKGNPEFESVNPEHFISDSECIESDIVSLIDKGLSRDVLANNINILIKDRMFWAEHQRSHVEAIQTLSSTVKELKEQIQSNNSPKEDSIDRQSICESSFYIPKTFSKYDIERKEKIKNFINEFK